MNFVRVLPTHIRVSRIRRGEITRTVWNEFAELCGASFRCAYDAPTWQFDHNLPFRLKRFEIFGYDRKIGQCAVAVGGKGAAFLDGLQLLPEYTELWPTAMAVVLNELGPGRYRYGSRWTVEPAREHAMRELDGVTVERVEPIIVHAIDFSRWRCWDDYLGQVSKNARRNAARAQKAHPELRLRLRRGVSGILDTKAVTKLQMGTLQRKDVSNQLRWRTLRYLLRVATMRGYSISAVAETRARQLAAFSGIQFGALTYYLTGGSTANCEGASWYLMLAMIQRAYVRTHGNGKFLMGSVEEQSAGWSNLLRSREQCRVTEMPTSIVEFSYSRSHHP